MTETKADGDGIAPAPPDQQSYPWKTSTCHRALTMNDIDLHSALSALFPEQAARPGCWGCGAISTNLPTLPRSKWTNNGYMLHPIQLRSIIRADTTQVNEPNIPYRFENIFQYHYGILQKSNIEIRFKLQYRFKMVLLVLRIFYYSL